MLDFTYLWKGKWLSVVSPVCAPYECVLENSGVQILPILLNEECIVIRKEYCPPYFIKDEKPRLYYTIMSGNIEPNESYTDALYRELSEESGIINPNIEWYEEGNNIPICKSTSYRARFILLGITDYDLITPEGDGTECEEKSISIKVTYDELEQIIENEDNYDYLLYGIYYKIKDLMREGKL
jgi:hypothetical protein